MNDRLTLLLASTYTVDDLHRRIGLWRSVLETVVFTEETVPDAHELQRTIAEQCDERDRVVVAAWPEAVWQGVTSQNLAAEAAALMEAVKTLSTTIVYLPTLLEAHDVAALGSWCRSECGITLLDIKIDPQVIGGCGVVGANATYHEHSLRTALADQSGIITKLIEEYA